MKTKSGKIAVVTLLNSKHSSGGRVIAVVEVAHKFRDQSCYITDVLQSLMAMSCDPLPYLGLRDVKTQTGFQEEAGNLNGPILITFANSKTISRFHDHVRAIGPLQNWKLRRRRTSSDWPA